MSIKAIKRKLRKLDKTAFTDIYSCREAYAELVAEAIQEMIDMRSTNLNVIDMLQSEDES